MNFSSSWIRLKSFTGECIRGLRVTRKPDAVEFKTIVKAAGLGMAIIGLIGFLFTMARQIFFP